MISGYEVSSFKDSSPKTSWCRGRMSQWIPIYKKQPPNSRQNIQLHDWIISCWFMRWCTSLLMRLAPDDQSKIRRIVSWLFTFLMDGVWQPNPCWVTKSDTEMERTAHFFVVAALLVLDNFHSILIRWQHPGWGSTTRLTRGVVKYGKRGQRHYPKGKY